MSNIENVNKEELASFKPTLSRTMSVNVHEDEYALSKSVMTWAYTLDTGACNDPLNGGKPSELEKIVDKKRTLQIEEEEEEEEEPEEGIGCNACYACVTGGCSPCIQDVNIER